MAVSVEELRSMPLHLQKTQQNVDKLLKEAYPDVYGDKNDNPNKEKESSGVLPVSETGTPKTTEAAKTEQIEMVDDLIASVSGKEEVAAVEKPKNFEQMYKILKGKYDAEVPRALAENKQLRQQVANLETTVESRIAQAIEVALTKQTADASKIPGSSTSFTTIDLQNDPEYQEFQKEYPETAKNLNKIIQSQAASNKQLLDKLNQFQSQIDQSTQFVQKSEKDRFNDSLSAKIPTWNTIDRDPLFHQWLQSVDPYSGQPKAILLADAYKQRNLERTARFFEDYLKESNTGQSSASTHPNTPNDELGTDNESESNTETTTTIEDLVAPPRSSNPAPRSSNEIKFITRGQIKKHYKDVENALKGHGPYYGQAKKQEAVQKAIDEALSGKGKYRIV